MICNIVPFYQRTAAAGWGMVAAIFINIPITHVFVLYYRLPWVPIITMTVIVTTYLALVLTIIRRDRRRIRDSAGSLCPRCGYDLRALPPSGPCPECGTPYTIDDVRRLWARTFHLPPAPTTPATPATPPNNHTDP